MAVSPARAPNLRYLCGLRFEGRWEYLLKTPSGRQRWTLLSTGHDHPGPRDPHGLWWCVRRCVAVLRQQTWGASHLPLQLPPDPEAREMVEILDVLLPGWKLLRHVHAGSSPMRCAQALNRGGGALLTLEFDGNDEPGPRVAWAWVVGVEMPPSMFAQDLAPPVRHSPRRTRRRAAPQDREAQSPAPSSSQTAAPLLTPSPSPSAFPPQLPTPPQSAQAYSIPPISRLLVVLPPDWTPPMPGNYAARIAVDARGNCSLEQLDGTRSACRWRGTVVLENG
jgi:hypothetical protein